MRAAAEIIKKEVKAARTREEHHPFESFDLSKLRTHSMKKTARNFHSDIRDCLRQAHNILVAISSAESGVLTPQNPSIL